MNFFVIFILIANYSLSFAQKQDFKSSAEKNMEHKMDHMKFKTQKTDIPNENKKLNPETYRNLTDAEFDFITANLKYLNEEERKQMDAIAAKAAKRSDKGLNSDEISEQLAILRKARDREEQAAILKANNAEIYEEGENEDPLGCEKVFEDNQEKWKCSKTTWVKDVAVDSSSRSKKEATSEAKAKTKPLGSKKAQKQ